MPLRFTAIISALVISSTAFSAVTVKVPEEIKIVAVNDQEVSSGLLAKSQYKIKAGENTINVRYSGYFQHADNSHDILKSGIVALKTPALVDGETYRLALIHAPQDFDEAQKYKDQPIFGLYNKENKLLVQQAGTKSEQKNWFSDALFNNQSDDLTNDKAVVNQTAAIQSVSASGNQEQPLIHLWQQSSKAERQEFMAWVAEQSN
ncbi:DUF2057 family protein [Acinetobacter pragensis]|uniref:DUF2057 domain-containing protein n=1 Tax=Acinetobacter pragensis TaxID=1806892 RepID=A0A151XXZ7_9GAMM|nr:DUF2057 family protein [Acinetobacter pragensis]KYQ70636.1 hypothetical protein AZH43_03990 [Acinetobacter pragensis]